MIDGLMSHNTTALAGIPGATNEIIAAGLYGMKEGYILGFRYVWVAAGCFTALAAICECFITFASILPFGPKKTSHCLVHWLTQCYSAAIFIVDPTKEFNLSIDAPAEKYEDLFA